MAKVFVAILGLLLLGACSNPYAKMIQELQDMSPPDLSFVVKPEYKNSKEALESKIKELYDAEDIRFGVSHTYRMNPATNAQENERFWISVKILNSSSIDINDEAELNVKGKEVAGLVMNELSNDKAYNKVEVVFIYQWQEGQNFRKIRHPEYYNYPGFESSSWGE